MAGLQRELVVHLDRSLGLEMSVLVGSEATAATVKQMLAEADPTGSTDPSGFRLRLCGGGRFLADCDPVPRAAQELDLAPGDAAEAEAIEMDGSSEAPYEDSYDDQNSFQEDDGSDVSDPGQDDGGDRDFGESTGGRKPSYAILSRTQLQERQNKNINDVADLLQVTQAEGFILLCEYGWDVARLQEAWFSDEDAVREKCGLCSSQQAVGGAGSSSTAVGAQTSKRCPICLEYLEDEALVSMDCGHGFCKPCWQRYLETKADDGKACVRTRCPQYKCRRSVPSDFFAHFCDATRAAKYQDWCAASFVEDNPAVKWCTNPTGCQFAAECRAGGSCEIQCKCGFCWCWQCGEEVHRPADCETVNKWNVKCGKESENINWIKENTKKCPKCRKPIEKNQGCNHMKCTQNGGCGHEFCWLCLGDWSKHGQETGGYYKCNMFDKSVKDGKTFGDKANKDDAKANERDELSKYMFYFERFRDHDRGITLTIKEEQELEARVQVLHDKQGFAVTELQFLFDAIRQVRTCRRVLKWTYVYGYYLQESGPEKNLFEHLQKNLEEKTDNLHEMLEKDLDSYDDKLFARRDGHAKFKEFTTHVTNFASVMQNFMTRILADLGAGESLTRSNA